MSNVPFIGPRSRYNLLSRKPSWVYQEMIPTACFTREAPETATTSPSETDPTMVTAGAIYKDLTVGGIFPRLYNGRKPFIIEEVYNPGNSEIWITHPEVPDPNSPSGIVQRQVTAADLPVRVAAGERVELNQGAVGQCLFGMMIYEDIPER